MVERPQPALGHLPAVGRRLPAAAQRSEPLTRRKPPQVTLWVPCTRDHNGTGAGTAAAAAAALHAAAPARASEFGPGSLGFNQNGSCHNPKKVRLLAASGVSGERLAASGVSGERRVAWRFP